MKSYLDTLQQSACAVRLLNMVLEWQPLASFIGKLVKIKILFSNITNALKLFPNFPSQKPLNHVT